MSIIEPGKLTPGSPEVFTTESRAKANAVVQIIHYSVSLIITQCSPIALERVGWKYYVSSEKPFHYLERQAKADLTRFSSS